MRELVRYPEAPTAAQLGDILLADGIETTINLGRDGQTVVWVHEETQLARARELLAEFQGNPTDPRFASAIRLAKERRAEKRRAEASRPPLIRARDRFLGPRQGGSYALGPVSAALILASVAVAVLTRLGEQSDMVQRFSYASFRHEGSYVLWNGLAELGAGQVLPRAHADLSALRLSPPAVQHVVAKDLGSMIERRQSSFFLGALVLVVAAASNTAQYLVGGPAFGGMSGVVYGLFGYIWMRGHFDPASGYALSRQDTIWMMLWLVCAARVWCGRWPTRRTPWDFFAGALWAFPLRVSAAPVAPPLTPGRARIPPCDVPVASKNLRPNAGAVTATGRWPQPRRQP